MQGTAQARPQWVAGQTPHGVAWPHSRETAALRIAEALRSRGPIGRRTLAGTQPPIPVARAVVYPWPPQTAEQAARGPARAAPMHQDPLPFRSPSGAPA